VRFDHIPQERLRELKRKYRSDYGDEEFGQDWQEAWRRHKHLAAYLSSYGPAPLADAVKASNPAEATAAAAALPKEDAWVRGAELFGQHCARCHSSKQLGPLPGQAKERLAFVKDFAKDNFFADDR